MALRGLTVGSDQTLRLDGVRFRNIGLNTPGALVPVITQPSGTACTYTTGAEQDTLLDAAVAMKAKVIRVSPFGYWPGQWRYGLNAGKTVSAATAADREAHYLKLDDFLTKCEARGIGVILSMCFRLASPSDLCGQQIRAGWLTAGSATRNFVAAITQELATRYLTRAGVYGWELSNEVNHYNDASDANMGNYPGVSVGYGTMPSYSSAADIFRGEEWASVVQWWYGVVSAVDNQRIVMTGNGPNSYSQPGGAPGISNPMMTWHKEQVRDNPTNCGSIHFYGVTGYGSASLRGLDAVLTGVRHWQKQAGRGFVVGEFGGISTGLTALSGNGTTLTLTCTPGCNVEVGDQVQIETTGSVFDGQTLTLASVDASRSSLTAACSVSGSWSGSSAGLIFVPASRVTRLCNEVISSGTDVAMFWELTLDPGRQFGTLPDAKLTAQQAAITAANTSLGW